MFDGMQSLNWVNILLADIARIFGNSGGGVTNNGGWFNVIVFFLVATVLFGVLVEILGFLQDLFQPQSLGAVGPFSHSGGSDGAFEIIGGELHRKGSIMIPSGAYNGPWSNALRGKLTTVLTLRQLGKHIIMACRVGTIAIVEAKVAFSGVQ